MYRKSKHKSKSHRREGESGWKWDETHQNWYYPYQDDHGNTQYEWAPLPDATAVNQEEIPKSHTSSVETITEGMASLSQGAYDAQTAEDESYTVASGHKSKSKSSKSKGKARQQEYDAQYESVPQESYMESPTQESRSAPEATVTETSHDTHDASTEQNPADTSSKATHSESHTDQASYGGQSSYGDQPSYSEQASYVEQASYGDQPSYGGSYMAAAADYSHDGPEVQAEMADYNQYAYANAGGSSTTAYDYGGYEEEDGRATPKAHERGGLSEFFDELEEEGKLDSRYRVQPSSAFQPGAIFMVYWAEPKGAGGKDDAVSSKRSYENKLGVKFYYGIRRFIVVANDQGHATVVPVLTYGRKACKKKGVKPDKHGIIYQQGHKARLLDREPQLGFAPVCAEITEEGEKLSKESRINYSKLTSVEHNFRVLFIGHIYGPDFDIVHDAVNTCWEAKTHHRKKHKR